MHSQSPIFPKAPFLGCALLLVSAAAAQPSPFELPIQQRATYSNPILEGMADPHVLRVADTYYLYPTSHTRGYDVYVSMDLVHWENKGLAFDDPRGGVWAPDVFHNRNGDGKFYLYYTDNMPDVEPGPRWKQIGVAVADSPLGPFEDKATLVKEAIDAHVFQDDDGKLYLYFVSFANSNRIMVQPMKDLLTLEGEPKTIIEPTEEWERHGFPVAEGAFMLKHRDTYYLTYSGSAADHYNYAIGYATASSPLGPFTKYEGNPIGPPQGDVVGPGHHSVVQSPDGTLWMVYHQKYDKKPNYHRFVALDPIWFDQDGVLRVTLTRGTKEPGPGLNPASPSETPADLPPPQDGAPGAE